MNIFLIILYVIILIFVVAMYGNSLCDDNSFNVSDCFKYPTVAIIFHTLCLPIPIFNIMACFYFYNKMQHKLERKNYE